MADSFISDIYYRDIIFMAEGAWRTILLAVTVTIFGTIVGIGLGILKSGRLLLGRFVVDTTTDILRSVPSLVSVVIVYALFNINSVSVSVFWAGTIALSASAGAYISEVVADALLAVPSNLKKATRGLGLTGRQAFIYVTFPVALRQAFPAWLNIILGALKETSVVAAIGYIELLRATQIVINRTFEPMILLSVAALFYFCISFPLSVAGRRLERSLNKGEML